MKAYPRRLRWLFAVVALLAAVYALRPFLVSTGSFTPLPSGMTNAHVAEGLEGQQMVDTTVTPSGSIVLRKADITSLSARGFDASSIIVQFNINHRDRNYRVEGKLMWNEQEEYSEHGRYRFYHFDTMQMRENP